MSMATSTKEKRQKITGFSGYDPMDNRECQQAMAMDIITTVQGFLRNAGAAAKHPQLTAVELLAAGDLLQWAEDCIRSIGYDGKEA